MFQSVSYIFCYFQSSLFERGIKRNQLWSFSKLKPLWSCMTSDSLLATCVLISAPSCFNNCEKNNCQYLSFSVIFWPTTLFCRNGNWTQGVSFTYVEECASLWKTQWYTLKMLYPFIPHKNKQTKGSRGRKQITRQLN